MREQAQENASTRLMRAEQYTQRVLDEGWLPRTCVWELTLACSLRCVHCGSRAGSASADEMSLEQCLHVAAQLGDLGCRVVTLSGGEPTMREGWDELALELAKKGVYVNMITHGVYADAEQTRDVLARALTAGMGNIGVSLDGPAEVHDAIRGAGSFQAALSTLELFAAGGMKTAVLTTVSRWNLEHLEALHRIVIDAGVSIWRLQLAVPMGSMQSQRDWVLRPAQLLELMPLLARLKQAGGVRTLVADTLGYYGPYDRVLRGRTGGAQRSCWKGCQAGMKVLGIEANGNVKGCLSLQAHRNEASDPFVEGNLQRESLASIWFKAGSFAYNRELDVHTLEGVCRRCTYAELCRGGARCVAAATGSVLAEAQYCYHRLAQQQQRSTRREQLVAAAASLALVGLLGCGEEDERPDVAPAYGVDPELLEQSDSEEPDAMPAYGVVPDLGEQDLEQPAYGVSPDLSEPDAELMPAYGVMPDLEDDG
jgi:radical SAM protein with 4Fe4S-binding SPASM domain